MRDAQAASVRIWVDEAALKRLEGAVGADQLRDLIEACLTDVRASQADLASAGAAGDAARARRAAHKLAGVLGQFACPAAAKIAREMAESSGEAVLSLLPKTEDAVSATVSRLQTLFRIP